MTHRIMCDVETQNPRQLYAPIVDPRGVIPGNDCVFAFTEYPVRKGEYYVIGETRIPVCVVDEERTQRLREEQLQRNALAFNEKVNLLGATWKDMGADAVYYVLRRRNDEDVLLSGSIVSGYTLKVTTLS